MMSSSVDIAELVIKHITSKYPAWEKNAQSQDWKLCPSGQGENKFY